MNMSATVTFLRAYVETIERNASAQSSAPIFIAGLCLSGLINDTLRLLLSIEYNKKNTHHLISSRAFESDT